MIVNNRIAAKRAVPQVAETDSVVAPVGGMNSFSPVSNMPREDALFMRDLFPQPYGAKLRQGYVKYATLPVSSEVRSLLGYEGRNGINKLFAVATNGSLYDASSAGPVPAALISGLTNAEFQQVMVANAGGSFLLAANGADDWIKYDGTSLTRVTNTDITVVNPRVIIGLEIHQRRLWMVEKGSTNGWYLAPDAISGAATKFDFGPLFSRGGYLQQLVTWTIDNGEGSDDHLCAISSKGEVAVYAGIDPANAATWSLQGVYYVGAPVGRRCAKKLDSDVGIITQFGFVVLSELVVSTKLNAQSEGPAYKIQNLVSDMVTRYAPEYGWEMFMDPTNNMLVINIPLANGSSGSVYATSLGQASFATQFVMNTITKSWCTFSNIPALCWKQWANGGYFGAAGYVGKFNVGYTDAADYLGNNGSAVIGKAIQAYTYFGKPGLTKNLGLFRPVFVGQGEISFLAQSRINFDTTIPPDPVLTSGQAIVSTWDVSLFDYAYWSGSLSTYQRWATAEGEGFAVSIAISLTSNSDVYWTSTDWAYEVGGIL